MIRRDESSWFVMMSHHDNWPAYTQLDPIGQINKSERSSILIAIGPIGHAIQSANRDQFPIGHTTQSAIVASAPIAQTDEGPSQPIFQICYRHLILEILL
jgi:hypothetical protein